MRLLRPGDATNEIDNWVEEVVGDNYKAGKEIDRTIADLRFRVAQFNLPFLSLPVGTPKDVALDVFIKVNTSSVALSTFDIIVAQVESAADESLHDLVAKLMEQVPAAAEYKNPDDLILDVAALMQDRTPSRCMWPTTATPQRKGLASTGYGMSSQVQRGTRNATKTYSSGHAPWATARFQAASSSSIPTRNLSSRRSASAAVRAVPSGHHGSSTRLPRSCASKREDSSDPSLLRDADPPSVD